MLFSSNVFVYLFLPAVLIGYYFIHLLGKIFRFDPRRVKNGFLLAASLVFYAYGGGKLVFLLIFTVLFNYVMALIMGENPKKYQLVITIVVDIGLLVWFKYLDFLISGISAVASLITGGGIADPFEILLPIGISFYMFQALSYVIDVYRKDVPVQKNFFKVMLYISFFPQLIAGPIVRYTEVRDAMDSRKESFSDVYRGICRFAIGLGKKVLIADVMGHSVDMIFALDAKSLSAPLAWVGILLYTLQIFYDFSGYSDMAIGMAKMFGFSFRENFLQPYTSHNITEFWGRWHVSLSSFLKDYLYIPLGGNRKGEKKTYVNLLIVFILCGLWHGAAWTFVAWGLYHGILRMAERLLKTKFRFELKGIWGQAITFILVLIGWVFFRSADFRQAFDYLGAMFGAGTGEALSYYTLGYYADTLTIVAGAAGLVLAVVPFNRIRKKLTGGVLYGIASLAILVLALIFLSDASFNPFIYFRF